jgi:SEC-C motif
MPERTLEERYRLLAASFRESGASASLSERLGAGFAPALEAVVAALWRDVSSAPRDLDREKVASLLSTMLPGRLSGAEPWKLDVPDVAEAFLLFVAEEESLSTAWEWRSAIDESRDAFAEALASPKRTPLGSVKHAPDRRPSEKLGRNDPCFCGSGKKYKHCCLKLFP